LYRGFGGFFLRWRNRPKSRLSLPSLCTDPPLQPPHFRWPEWRLNFVWRVKVSVCLFPRAPAPIILFVLAFVDGLLNSTLRGFTSQALLLPDKGAPPWAGIIPVLRRSTDDCGAFLPLLFVFYFFSFFLAVKLPFRGWAPLVQSFFLVGGYHFL